MKEGVLYREGTGLDRIKIKHCALPELALHEIDTRLAWMGQSFSFPLFISSMTGGYQKGAFINEQLARFAQQNKLPMGVGSQRAMMEDQSLAYSFESVRKAAPDIFIASNIGGIQLASLGANKVLSEICQPIAADAIIVHLNSLQELMQPEGDRDFRGIKNAITDLVQCSPIPVIVKETGAGISAEVAARLLHVGVSCIDVAGAGGTSWAKVELERGMRSHLNEFAEWGIPTTECLLEVEKLRGMYSFSLMASGGISSGIDATKALCLGADLVGVARPLIKALIEQGFEGLQTWFEHFQEQFCMAMLLSGSQTLHDLSTHKLVKINT